MVVPPDLKGEERELEGMAWKIRSTKVGTKTRLRYNDVAKGLKLMTKSQGQNKKWRQATKMLVEWHVAKHGGKKRQRDETQTSPSENFIPKGRRQRQNTPEPSGGER